MRHRVTALWQKVCSLRSWLLRDDLADTYPRKDAESGLGPTPDRHVNLNAPPGGGVF